MKKNLLFSVLLFLNFVDSSLAQVSPPGFNASCRTLERYYRRSYDARMRQLALDIQAAVERQSPLLTHPRVLSILRIRAQMTSIERFAVPPMPSPSQQGRIDWVAAHPEWVSLRNQVNSEEDALSSELGWGWHDRVRCIEGSTFLSYADRCVRNGFVYSYPTVDQAKASEDFQRRTGMHVVTQSIGSFSDRPMHSDILLRDAWIYIYRSSPPARMRVFVDIQSDSRGNPVIRTSYVHTVWHPGQRYPEEVTNNTNYSFHEYIEMKNGSTACRPRAGNATGSTSNSTVISPIADETAAAAI